MTNMNMKSLQLKNKYTDVNIFGSLVECSPMVWVTWVQSQVASYQRL